MKQSDAKEFLPLIQAWAEGKTLQTKDPIRNTWEDVVCNVGFTYSPSVYRIKPEPRTFYAVEYAGGEVVGGAVTDDKTIAARWLNTSVTGVRVITLREVMDEHSS